VTVVCLLFASASMWPFRCQKEGDSTQEQESRTNGRHATVTCFLSDCGVAVCCSVLQCVAVCCSVLCCSVLQCVVVCCSVLCCSVLQCAVVCCSAEV